MATAYLARDLRHGRHVAVKVMRPELAATAVAAGRFLREIHVAARLQHPHIIPMLDSGEARGQLWYAMPYIRGESLRDLLDRDPALPIGVAVRARTRAGGLAASPRSRTTCATRGRSRHGWRASFRTSATAVG